METQILSVIVYALALGLMVWLVNFIVETIPVPAPYDRYIKLVLAIAAVILLVGMLFQLASGVIVHPLGGG